MDTFSYIDPQTGCAVTVRVECKDGKTTLVRQPSDGLKDMKGGAS